MPEPGQIKISIAAGLDRSVEASFGSLEKMAERTGRVVQKNLGMGGGSGSGAGAAALGRGFQAAAREADKASRAIEQNWNKQVRAAEKASKDEYRAWQKGAQDKIKLQDQAAREQDKALRQETRNAEREAANQVKAATSASKKIEAEHQRFASRTSQRSVRFLFPNPIGAFGMASRIGGDILRGAGVDFSIAGSVNRAIGTQSLATQLSNQGYMKGEAGPNGTRVAASALETEARSTALTQHFDPEAILRAQTKFVDITGNLHDARAAMPNITALAGASGTDPEKMAEAWANVSRHIGDVPNKAEKVYGLMKLIAGQGRVGSDEIKNMAPHLSQLAAAADRYAGSDKAKTIGELTTLSQLAKAEGGAASSAQAATAVSRFTDLFATPARANAMIKGGLKESDLYATDAKGNKTGIKDPLEIIKKALTATGGDLLKMNNMFKSVMAGRAVNGLTAAFTAAGGGKAGLAAVDQQFATFGKEAAFSDEQIKENNDVRGGTDAAKAQDFQNALDGVISTTKNELTPALVALSGPTIQAAHYLAEMVTWAAKNPMEAVGLAITGAIARATVESAFRAGIEKMITGAMGSGGIKMLAPVAITIAAATVVMHLIDEDIKEREAKQTADAIANGRAGELENDARSGIRGGVISEKGKSDLTAIDANLESRIKKAEFYKQFDAANGGAPTGLRLGVETALHPERGAARNDLAHLAELKSELADNKRVLDMIRTGTLRVMVTNASDIGGDNEPKVFMPGRQPHPGGLPAYLYR